MPRWTAPIAPSVDSSRRLLVVTVETTPPPFPSLRELLGALPAADGWELHWVGSERPTPGEAAAGWALPASITLIPSARDAGLWGLVATQLRRAQRLGVTVRAAAGGAWSVVIVRDDAFLALLFALACRRAGSRMLFQVSHLKEEEAITIWARRGWYGSPAGNRLRGAIGIVLRTLAVHAAHEVLVHTPEMRARLGRGELLPEGVSDARCAVPAADLRAPVLVYVGTLARARQPEFLLDVLARVRAQVPDARLLVLGEGRWSDEREGLAAAARRRGLQDAAQVSGAVSQAAVAPALAHAAIGLNPLPDDPLFAANSPIKTLEYMAAGLPVVATDLPEHRRTVGAAGAGRLVPYDAAAFADACVALLRDPVASRAAGERGRAWVRSQRTFERLYPRLADLMVNSSE